jgi:glutamate-1-semialdehyde 2,1-aminomutase
MITEAINYLPGGLLATAGYSVHGPPDIILSHGSGAYVYSTVGDRFMDAALGSASLLLGHCPPAVVTAVREQLERGTVFSPLINVPVVELARLMVEAIPCAKKVRFTNSGSEAALLALRLVRAFSRKDRILKFAGAYHGFADPLLFLTNYGEPEEWPEHPRAIPDTVGMPTSLSSDVLVAPYNDIDRTREIVHEHHSELAAIFVEPVMRGIGSVPGFLEGVRELATQYHVPLVFDEVITGFRVAYGGAQQFYGVTADVAIYGKGLGAGYPIGAVAGKDEIMSFLDPASPDGRRIFALGSLHGNPLCATAAVANLKELKTEGTYYHLNRYGNGLREGLSDLFARYGLHAQMTGAGSIVEFFFTSEPITDYLSAMRSNLRIKSLLGRELPRHGVFGGGGRYTASTCHGDKELAIMLEAVDASLGAIKKTGELR